MKKLLILFASFLCIQIAAFSQKKIYGVFENKTLFQIGLVEDSAGNHIKSILRFAPFANYTLQAHKDFNNKFGLYTGIGIKNVGFIIKGDSANMKIKSRAYCLSIPVGIKIGNLDDEKYVFLGGEFLTQFDYKEKVFQDGDKSKRKNLYNNDINTFNYSTTVGLNYKGFLIGAEYTFGGFFNDQYKFIPDKSNQTAKAGGYTKSNIVTFFFGFRTNLSADKAAAPEKQLQQARAYQF